VRRASASNGIAAMKYLWGQKAFRNLSAALIVLYIMGTGFYPWYSAFMIRSHGIGTAELGTWLGLIFGIAGISGIALGGYLSSRWYPINAQAQLRLCAFSVSLLVPCFVAFLTLPGRYEALIALVPLIVLFTFCLGPTYALMQRLVDDDMRATAMAVVMLLANLLGFGLGPLLVGGISDLLAPRLGTESLRYAMLCMSFVALWSAYYFWRAGLTVNEELRMIASTPAAACG